jgi:transposase
VSKRLLPVVLPDLSVVQILPARDHIIIVSRARRPHSCCPDCRVPSARVHSRYERKVADLPWQGRAVVIRIQARRFFCVAPACRRRTFTERLPSIVRPSARRTLRLADIHDHLGLALGGEPGARLSDRLAMPVSADTLLRQVCKRPSKPVVSPRVVGIDEWAWRRGRRFGTIVVDLERNCVVDLLPDRQAATVAAWLRDHPSVEIVARDRADVFADGIRAGAPSAVHVADRWHLLKNLSEAVQTIIGRNHAAVRKAARDVVAEKILTRHAERTVAETSTKAQIRSRQKQARWQSRYEEVRRLREGGASISRIARVVGLDTKTVRGWLRNGGPPTWRKRPRRTALDPYRAHLERRWSEGCRNAATLWRELVTRGFHGHARVVRAWATQRRKLFPDSRDVPAGMTWKPPSIVHTARLLQADPTTLSDMDQAFVKRLRTQARGMAAEIDLANRLRQMLRKETAEDLETWLGATKGTALTAFATGLRKDLDAVKAALVLPWSTSPAEGQINRLKMLKRSMYGRAGFTLLRQRVLNAA